MMPTQTPVGSGTVKPVRLSLLDVAAIGQGETIADSFAGSVALAQRAEETGYLRVWYAEHHNIASIASSATSVLIAHIAAHTRTIRLGAGGVMLPNHSPLVIAEQFGTLATLHPDRIDLGLGRAPGGAQATFQALRRDPAAAQRFPDDIVELRGLLSDHSPIPGVRAIPGEGTHIPLYVLGSSLFGAQLAATLGLPYAFASHFAPAALEQAISAYRDGFQPSAQLAQPYVIASLNTVAADTEQQAQEHLQALRRDRARNRFATPERPLTETEIDAVLASPQARAVDDMLTYTAIGTASAAVDYLTDFAARTGVDELMLAHHGPTASSRLRSLELVADQAQHTGLTQGQGLQGVEI